MNMERITWDEYFISMASFAAIRSTCKRRDVGAIAVKDNVVIATGYNGAPSGIKHCTDIGCMRDNIKSGERHELCRGVHAEQNVICQAAMYGHALNGATLYVTLNPCVICAKMIVNVGIKKVVYASEYTEAECLPLFYAAGIEVKQMIL